MTAVDDAPIAVGEVASLTVTLRIKRMNPEGVAGPAGQASPSVQASPGGQALAHAPGEEYWEEFTVQAHATDRVLDALHKIKWEQDGTLAFRRSCAHGVCGSDAMRINAKNRLACKTLLKDLNPAKPILVEPIAGLPVEKDLIVDMEPFFASYRSIMPFLITTGPAPERERRQSAADREKFEDTTKCILCAACTTSCPVFWTDGQYFGPQAIVGAHRFIFDSRDEGQWERLEILNDKAGVWKCRTTFNCTDACPRGIEVTKAISDVKRVLNTGEI